MDKLWNSVQSANTMTEAICNSINGSSMENILFLEMIEHMKETNAITKTCTKKTFIATIKLDFILYTQGQT